MRPHRPSRIIRAVARLVPADERATWVREWQAEWAFARSRELGLPTMARRLAAAALHALYLRAETFTMRDIVQDLRFARRTLRRQPLLTATIAITFALGIGANAALFSVVRNTLLKPLPLKDADRLVLAWQVNARGGKGAFSYPDYVDWISAARTIDRAAAMSAADGIASGVAEADRVHTRTVTASWFGVTGLAVRGRTFTDADMSPGAERVALVSAAFVARMGGTPPIGATFNLEGIPRRIVGVFDADPLAGLAPPAADVLLPLLLRPQVLNGRGNRNLTVLAHLADGATPAAAHAEFAAFMGALGPRYPETNAGRGGYVATLKDELGATVGRSVWLAGLVTAIVLLAACANIAGLLLARNADRAREFTVRAALGARRWRLVRQLLTESTLLALIGASLAIAVLAFAAPALTRLLPPALPRRSEVRLDALIVALTLAAALVTAWIAALPAALAATPDRAAGFGHGAPRTRVRQFLVASQFAAAVCLIVCVALLGLSFGRLQRVDPGFAPDHVVRLQVNVPPQYTTAAGAIAFVDRVVEAVEATPGVERAGLFGPVPFGGDVNGWEVTSPGVTLPAPMKADRYTTTAHAMSVMGVTLLRGRLLEGADFLPGSATNTVVDELLARQMFGDADPLGRTIQLESNPPLTIVGVTRHIRHYGFAEHSRPQLYVPFAYDPASWLNLVVRSGNEDANAVIHDVRRAVLDVDPAAPPYEAVSMRALIDRSVADRRTASALMSALAGVTLLIAIAGLHGAIAFSVQRRTREIGVRMALGAEKRGIAALVVREALSLAAVGLAAGLAAAAVTAGLLRSFLFQTTPFEPVAYGAAAAVAIAVALAAAIGPARRASAVDPLIALRSE